MELNGVRAEVQRRIKRAEDLGIRESLRGLLHHWNQYRAWLTNDPQFAEQLKYPDLVVSGDEVRFSIEQTPFSLKHKVRSLSSERARETLTLNVNADDVFEFNIEKTTTFGQFDVWTDEHFGEIIRFIEGLWVTQVREFSISVAVHSAKVLNERNAPREAKQAEELKKRFGL
jgi:hypothetical protein